MGRLRLGMAQINSTVGDFEGNTRKILEAIAGSKSLGIDLITFPELAVCGYPPEDLLLKPHFIEKNLLALREIAGECRGITAVIGFVDRDDGIYNAAAIIHKGRVIDIYHKIHLPNYGVFDEYRYFKPGQRYPVYNLGGISIGINICEDIWCQFGPTHYQTAAGAELIINISASPYYFRRLEDRRQMLSSRARDNIAIVAYNNLVGGQDELVFDGGSMVFDESGQLIASGRQFVEELIITDLDTSSIAAKRRASPGWPRQSDSVEPEPATPQITIAETLPVHSQAEITTQLAAPLEPEAEIYQALVLGTGDYVRKNGFQKVLIGLSVGIDSSLVAAIAVDALGAANVIGIAMPSQYSSTGSLKDARELTDNLGIKLLTIPIKHIFQEYLAELAPTFGDAPPNVAEENLQARIRGNLLMAISNKFGWLVLTTGNKSEMATGYTTLYGDMAGGFAVIKDVPKIMVYRLCRFRNALGDSAVIPQAIIDKAPSAELRPEQRDSDSLPPYGELDAILTAYVEEDKSVEQIIAAGQSESSVRRTAQLVDRSEYKRRQAPPGVKITPKAFGRDRRLPITNRFYGGA